MRHCSHFLAVRVLLFTYFYPTVGEIFVQAIFYRSKNLIKFFGLIHKLAISQKAKLIFVYEKRFCLQAAEQEF